MRCRHHTNDEGLAGIRRDLAIHTCGIWRGPVEGVHVELPPFGAVWAWTKGHSAGEQVGTVRWGSYVEFDLPTGVPILPTSVGPLQTVVIAASGELDIAGLNPKFVWFRKWWQIWRILRRPQD